ncbi:YbaL family putative K(+) efflux transporter [Luteimonas sp. R10]|uniref:YbaL family putative K(+) efflux transporter n=1 Tax=Luteimonas sp. R10 TaxID=3108176 RepID=UPI00308F2DB4|nr:YbaL family putative K(+) efflux transporter [Luteimonas sp. R10]
MPHDISLISMLCVGFVLAFVLGLVAQRLRLSPLVGYLVAGIVAGPYTPGFVADQELAPQLAEIGVILLMFGVGLHFSLRDLMSVKAIALPGAIAQITVATLLGLGLGEYLGWSHGASLMFGLALSVASTVVLLRALEDRRLIESERGRIAVGWLIVEDLAMVLALVLIPALSGALGGQDADGGRGLSGTLLVTLLKVGAFVALMLLVGRRVIPWILERVAGTGSRELFTLGVLAIAMGVAFGAAELFGVSFALGAFFAGMLLNESEFSHKAAADSLPLRDAFAVLFFVSVGMLFDPGIVLERPLEVLATFFIIVFGKSAAAWAIVRLFGKPNSTALTISASLAQIGEFSFILAGLGLSLEILPADGHALVIAGALLSILVNPFIFTLLDRWQAREDARAAALRPPEPKTPPLDVDGHAILVGYGRVGSQLASLLQARGVPLVVVEEDADLVAKARQAGLLAVRGNVASEAVMAEALPARARMAIFAIPRALEAGETIARLRQVNPELSILARAHSDGEVKHLLAHGADAAVLAERELAYSLSEMVMSTPPYRPARAGATPTPAAPG